MPMGIRRKIESEKLLERKLSEKVKGLGGWAIKINTLQVTGLPDRLCLLPGGRVFFAEIKTTGERPRKIQKYVHEKLRKLGLKVYVIDDSKQINQIIEIWTI